MAALWHWPDTRLILLSVPFKEHKTFTDFSIERILSMPCHRNLSTPSPPSNHSSVDTASPPVLHRYENGQSRTDSSLSGVCDRKQRTVYDKFQLQQLELAFLQQQYMVGSDRELLAAQLGLTETQVRIWFQNRRCKWRKDMRQSKKTDSS